MAKHLNMRKGKMVAQGAHGAMANILGKMKSFKIPFTHFSMRILLVNSKDPFGEWLDGKFTKITVGANSEEELLQIYSKAIKNGLNATLITDSGLTEFGGKPTNTCVAIGPDDPEKIDEITGGLRLL